MLVLKTNKILADVKDHVGWLTFNRPEKHNAICLEMWQAIGDVLEAYENDTDVRAVVLQGAGGLSFASGADISEFDRFRGNSEQKKEYAKTSERAHHWLGKLSKPLVAKIDGYCIGGGLGIALSADIRFATPPSKFAIPAARLGLAYDYSGLAKLARLVGPSSARDILFSARHLNSEEALRIGLINFVYPNNEIEGMLEQYLMQVVSNAPLTLKSAKLSLNYFESMNHAVENPADFSKITLAIDNCFDSDDYREGRKAFSEKRIPEFKGK